MLDESALHISHLITRSPCCRNLAQNTRFVVLRQPGKVYGSVYFVLLVIQLCLEGVLHNLVWFHLLLRAMGRSHQLDLPSRPRCRRAVVETRMASVPRDCDPAGDAVPAVLRMAGSLVDIRRFFWNPLP